MNDAHQNATPREKIVNSVANFVKNTAAAKKVTLRDTIAMRMEHITTTGEPTD
jgi:hypothetical protein